MRTPFRHFDFRKTMIAAAAALAMAIPATAQSAPYRAPRAADGHADLGGIWQAINTANWDLQDHSPQQGPLWQLGAIGAEPAGQSVVEGGSIPYKPEKLAKKKENFENRRTNDPEAKCYMPGVPRANYMPYPFQIIQSPKGVLLVYEFASANRFVNMGKPQEAGSDTWMGTNNGHWEGDTLVIDVTGLNGLAWFDRAGDYATAICTWSNAIPVSILTISITKPPSKTRRSLPSPGRSACRYINWWTRTLNFWISSAWSSPKSCCTDSSRSRRLPTSEGSIQYAAPISQRHVS